MGIYTMGNSGHEYLKCTETAKQKTGFILGCHQSTSVFWFSIHSTSFSVKHKADLINFINFTGKMSLSVIT